MSNNIKPIPIKDLQGLHFFIPDYQRGYRWSAKQVTELLEDIDAFEPSNSASIYCIQPLVVKNRNASSVDDGKNAVWEVIDGQQRLTTIHILLNAIHLPRYYDLEYQTRQDSQYFLVSIEPTKRGDNIDYFHIVQAKEIIDRWLENRDIEHFKEKLLNHVKFIWYKTDEENPITVFTRMNIGKIALTNAELIKALIMNALDIPKERVSLQWDGIENTLENDEFWYFLNEKEDSPLQTRIDFIFDLIRKNRKLFPFPEVDHHSPDAKYATFQYFYDYLEEAKQRHQETESIAKIWERVLDVFYAFDEWYNNTELYHYIGFIVHTKVKSVSELLVDWFDRKNIRKDVFISQYVKPLIAKKISETPIDTVYEKDDNSLPKTACRPLLLLYNLQFIINENKQFKEGSKFKAGIHRRFPFHLFKTEHWDVEHIDSSTTNDLNDDKDIVSFLWTALVVLSDINNAENKRLIDDIDHYLTDTITSEDERIKLDEFDALSKRIDSEFGTEGRLKGVEEKNRVWNFVLLDRNTNRSYKNAIFPAKRRIIISRSQGNRTDIVRCNKGSEVKDNYKRIGNSPFYVVTTSGEQSFVPPCTLNAFLKFHTLSSSNLLAWTKADAQAYQDAMLKVLHDANLM